MFLNGRAAFCSLKMSGFMRAEGVRSAFLIWRLKSDKPSSAQKVNVPVNNTEAERLISDSGGEDQLTFLFSCDEWYNSNGPADYLIELTQKVAAV